MTRHSKRVYLDDIQDMQPSCKAVDVGDNDLLYAMIDTSWPHTSILRGDLKVSVPDCDEEIIIYVYHPLELSIYLENASYEKYFTEGILSFGTEDGRRICWRENKFYWEDNPPT